MHTHFFLACQLAADVDWLHQHLDGGIRHASFLLFAEPEEADGPAEVELCSILENQARAELFYCVVVVSQLHLHYSLHIEQLPWTLFSHFEGAFKSLTTVFQSLEQNEDEGSEVMSQVMVSNCWFVVLYHL
jgi:hypothetical protein